MAKRPNKWWIYLASAFLVLGSFYLVYSQVQKEGFWRNTSDLIQNLDTWQISVIVLLSACFWLVDTSLWQLLVRPFAKVKIAKLLKLNVVAQSTGLLTPLMLGDYALRSFLLKAYIHPGQNVLITMAYQVLKLGTRVVLGLIAATYLLFSHQLHLFSVVVLVVFLMGFAFFLKRFFKLLLKQKKALSLLRINEQEYNIHTLPLHTAVLPALLIFIIYSLQTALLAFWFQGDAELLSVWITIVVIYGVTSFLPPLSFFDPLAKSAVGTLLYAGILDAEVQLVAFTCIWLLNRGVPAVLGSLLFSRTMGAVYFNAKETT